MAGIAPPPEPLGGSAGPFSELARSQYGALARMRWRLLTNSVRSVQGAFELGARSVTFLIYSLMGLGLGTGLCISAYIMASRTKWQPLPILFWVVFMGWQVLPIALASFQEQFDLNGLLRFPVNYRSFYLLQLVFGLIDIPALLGGICSLGIGIGVVLARPDLVFVTVFVLAIFAVFNIFTARAILAWLDRWLAQRRTREIVSALFLVLMLSLQLLNPALHEQGRHGPRTNSHSKLQHTQKELPLWTLPSWTRSASAVVEWLPPSLAADGLRDVAEHQPARALGALSVLGLYILAAGAALSVRLKAEFRGENLGEAPAQRKTKQGDRKWLIDGSGPIAAVVEKELRIIPRSLPLLFSMGAPLLTVLIIGTILRNSAPQGGPAFRLAFPLCVSYTLLGFSQMIYNNLGAEGTGIHLLFLSPTPIRTVLLAKNVFHALLYATVAVLAGVFAALRIGAPDAFILATTAAWLLFALPANLAAGNVLSLTMPSRMNLGRLSRQKGTQASSLISMLVQLGVIGVGVAIFELCGYFGEPWLAPIAFLALAALMVLVWMGVLRKADDLASRNKDALIGMLAKTE